MSFVTYCAHSLSGQVSIPPSKSAAHRAILCAALSQSHCHISPIELNNDIKATIEVIRSLGFSPLLQNNSLTFGSFQKPDLPVSAHCIESGSTLRFCIPIAAALGIPTVFTGEGRLPKRPIGCYLSCLPKHGVTCQTNGGLPLFISGKLLHGKYVIPGNISSQFITGLLFSLPLLNGDSSIELSTHLESASYVDMTISVLSDFGIQIIPSENGWKIPGGQMYSAQDYFIEGDWSQAAFFLAMGGLNPSGKPITISGLSQDSLQGDKAAVDIFKKFGVQIDFENNMLTVQNPNSHLPYAGLHGTDIDASQIPDMVPALAATAVFCEGTTRIYHAERVKLKESNRISAMQKNLSVLGADIEETDDGLLIHGKSELCGGNVSGFNDHRIVMALAASALRCKKPVTVSDSESIQKSYPNFFKDYQKIGGNANVFHMG